MPDLFRLRDFTFLLSDVLRLEELCEHPRYAEHSAASMTAMLEMAVKLAEEKFAPCAAESDASEPQLVDGRVVMPDSTGEAIHAYLDAGFLMAMFPEEDGGLGLPYLLSQAASAIFTAANGPVMAYPLLTAGAANLLRVAGSPAQKERYMRPMIEGRFFGTMALSEPQAGSSLADLVTKAEPTGDGRYRLTGSKMWITGAEHDLADNIIHLVLARLPDAPGGVKGISLFIVPRNRLDEDGEPAERNDAVVVGLNHKMGQRAAVNTVLALGDHNDCIGELVGAPHKGLAGMFHMMNEARISVGLSAAATAYAGYRHSLDYATGRPQGRRIGQRSGPQVPIIQHADVRRMLLAQKALTEGAMMLALYCARLVDEQQIAEDAGDSDTASELGMLLALLTPIVKAWPSEYGPKANDLAIQVHGGYGYTREYPVERLYRDNRLNPIHEGTNGIQALDLLGRKVVMSNGAAAMVLMQRIGADLSKAAAMGGAVGQLGEALSEALQIAQKTTMALMGVAMTGDHERFLANASVYLELMGHTVVAWMWLKQAMVAQAQLAERDDAFLRGKLAAARYFSRWELPRVRHWATLLDPIEESCLSMQAEWF